MQRRPVWFLLGAVLFVAGVTAFIHIRRPHSITGQELSSLLADAEVRLGNGDLAGARTSLERTLQLAPGNSRALLYLGQLLREEGRDGDALATLERVSPDEPSTRARACFLSAMIWLDRHHARLAEEVLLEASSQDPRYLLPRDRLVQLYTLQRRRRDVLRQLDGLALVRPLALHELALRVTAGERVTPAAEAIPALTDFVSADPDDIESGVALVGYLIDERQFSEAQRFLAAMMKSSHRDNRLCALELRLSLESGTAHLSSDCRRWLEEPDSGAWSMLEADAVSRWAQAQQEWQTCISAGLAVLTEDPLDQSACFRVGTGLQRIGRLADATRFLDRSRAISQLHERVEGVAIYLMRGQTTAEPLRKVARLFDALEEHQQAENWNTVAAAIGGPATTEDDEASGLKSAVRFQELVASLSMELAGAGPGLVRDRTGLSSARRDALRDAPFRFDDRHVALGVDHVYYNGQTGKLYLLESMGGGVAILDFDRDNWPDIFFSQGSDLLDGPRTGPRRDRLFRSQQARQFVDVTNSSGAGDEAYSVGCSAADFDADGFDDLFVANFGRCTLFHNRGDGTFDEVGAAAGLSEASMSMSLGPGDFDGDGDLDLYVVNYVDRLHVCHDNAGNIFVCSPATAIGVDDWLYVNDGEGRFHRDLSAGLPPNGKGLGVVVADLNSDGRPDIYVANDMTPNSLLINQSADGRLSFVEQGMLAGCATDMNGAVQAGMGIACGDVNGDQTLDLYVTNFFREPNTLYLNDGHAIFTDATMSTGLYEPTLRMLGFGTQAIDVDLDSHLDLFVTNGHIAEKLDTSEPWKMPPQLFQNLGATRFREVSGTSGDYFYDEMLGRGAATCDWNRDGLPDLVVVHQDRAAAILANQTATAARSVSCRLIGRRSNRGGLGAKLVASAGGETRLFEMTSGDGYCASNERVILIGLGTSDSADAIDVIWPSGMRQHLTDIPAGARLTIVEGTSALSSSGK